MRWAVLVVALGGCNAVLGLDPTKQRDSALPGIDAAIDGSPTIDGNGMVCASPFDEDGDTIKNDCDNCPTVPNPNQADIDDGTRGDGVGNACDPHPVVTGDQITLFAGFDTNAEIADWLMVGSWTLADGAYVASPTTSAPTMGALAPGQHAGGRVTTTVLPSGSSGSPVRRAGLVMAADATNPAKPRGYTCEITSEVGRSTLTIQRIEGDVFVPLSVAELNLVYDDAHDLMFEHRLPVGPAAGQLTCTVDNNISVQVNDDAYTTGRVGFTVLGTTAFFSNIVAYQ